VEVQRSPDGRKELVLDEEEQALLEDLSDWFKEGARHEVPREFVERLVEFVNRFSATIRVADGDLGGGAA
jgi:hypothetical protein